MLYHYTSRAHWERIAADGELKALSPVDLAYEPKVVHLTVDAAARGLPPTVVPEVVLCIREELQPEAVRFLDWWSLELPAHLQGEFEADIQSTPSWPVRPEVHWYVVKGPVPAIWWSEVRSVRDDEHFWP